MVVSWLGEKRRQVGWMKGMEWSPWGVVFGSLYGPWWIWGSPWRCRRISKAASSQGQAVGSFGKNIALNSPMGACSNMGLVALVHRVTEWPICDIHVPPFYTCWYLCWESFFFRSCLDSSVHSATLALLVLWLMEPNVSRVNWVSCSGRLILCLAFVGQSWKFWIWCKVWSYELWHRNGVFLSRV